MNSISHYFDWAATSPSDEEILQESLSLAVSAWGNPSSIHTLGKDAKNLLEDSRKTCAKVLGVNSEEIYFTSGGTESDQIALLSLLNKPQKGTVLISSIEHPAIREQAFVLKKCGWEVEQMRTDCNGIVTPEVVAESITDDTHLICVMAVNNETGIIQPIYEIADTITKVTKGKRRPKFHVDCVQAAGKIPLNIGYPGIDSAAFSAHKICGPRGIGILYEKNQSESFLRGGGQERGVRSGTENLYGAIAFSKVLEKYFLNEENKGALKNHNEIKQVCDEFIDELLNMERCKIIPTSRAEKENRDKFSPYIVQASFEKIPGQVMVRALDAKGFFISTGSACSVRKISRPVLDAMKVESSLRDSAVRFSFGPFTTKENIAELVDAVATINSAFGK